MGKTRRVIRVFFNTFYEEDARRALERLQEILGELRISRSSVVRELYYVEAPLPASVDIQALLERVRKELGSVSDTIFGVKAYAVTGDE